MPIPLLTLLRSTLRWSLMILGIHVACWTVWFTVLSDGDFGHYGDWLQQAWRGRGGIASLTLTLSLLTTAMFTLVAVMLQLVNAIEADEARAAPAGSPRPE